MNPKEGMMRFKYAWLLAMLLGAVTLSLAQGADGAMPG